MFFAHVLKGSVYVFTMQGVAKKPMKKKHNTKSARPEKNFTIYNYN